MSECSHYGSGHVYDNDGGYVYTCKCTKTIMFDESTKIWYRLENGQWVKDDQQ
jgi:hypothetical protein